jgi:hypothetical protein
MRSGLSLRLGTEDLVWYVAYGSNMRAARFGCYISGGRPRGAHRIYLGCGDQSPPRQDVGIHLAGGLTFAGRSSVWGGGMAFYNPHADGELAARAYLLTFGQLSDVVAQESRRPIGNDLTLGSGVDRRWATRSNIYETLVQVDDRDELPMLTITSLQDLEPTPPSAPYLRTMLDERRDRTAEAVKNVAPHQHWRVFGARSSTTYVPAAMGAAANSDVPGRWDAR